MQNERYKEAENEYFRLKGQFSLGRITRQQFDAALKELMFQDAQGRNWILGADNGKWYVHDGRIWVEANPYAATGQSIPPGYGTSLPPRGPDRGKMVAAGIGGAIALCLCASIGILIATSTGFLRISPASRNLSAANPTAFFFPPITPLPIQTIAFVPTTSTASFAVPATLGPSPIATPTVTATLELSPTATSTATATPTPTVAPGLYVTNLRLEPSAPKRREDVGFYVTYLNATGADQNYRWLVYIYRPDNSRHAFGETPKNVTTIPTGSIEQKAQGTWKLTGGGDCENFIARVAWIDANNQSISFSTSDGRVFEFPFSVCP